jgi:flagellar protein FliS
MEKNASQKYQTQQIMSASPAKLVAMLYDRAIGCLEAAIRAIEAGEIEARCRANSKALEIIGHLCMTLDLEGGGQIAANLDQLYRFMLVRLPEVDLRNDPAPARDVIKLLEPLRRSWHRLAERAEAGEPRATDGPPIPLADDQQRPDEGGTHAGIGLLA